MMLVKNDDMNPNILNGVANIVDDNATKLGSLLPAVG